MLALVVWAVLEFGVRYFAWYGRERIGCAMLIALILRAAFAGISPETVWLGWVVPGLIAADIQQEGVVVTLLSLATVSLATAFCTQLLFVWCPL